MRKPLVFAALLVAAVSGCALGAMPCEDLKAEIAKKLDAKGVKTYTLDIVDKNKEVEGKVVGSCDGGAKKVVYSRTQAAVAEKAPAAEPAKK